MAKKESPNLYSGASEVVISQPRGKHAHDI